MDTIVAKILELIEARKENANKVSIACGLNNSAITEWKKGKSRPSIDALCRLAVFFEVSVDYLLGRTQNPKPYDR